MKDAQIDEALWRAARELTASPDGLTIEGVGTIRGGGFDPSRAGPPPTGYDAPALVVRVATALGIDDDAVRARLRAEVKQAVASAVARPAPLGPLGLLEVHDGRVSFHPSRRTTAAPPDAVDAALTAWRAPAATTAARIDALLEALHQINGALSPADQRRLLDELDYDLDPDAWRQFGARIVEAFPF